MRTINLGEFRSHGSIILANSERGKEVRKVAGLDELDKNREPAEITAPEEIEKITASFVQGLLSASLTTLGSKSRVLERYSLRLPPHLHEDVLRGLEFAEKTLLPLRSRSKPQSS